MQWACRGGFRPGQCSLTVGPYGWNLHKLEGMVRNRGGRKQSPWGTAGGSTWICCRKGHGISGASMTKCDLRRGVSWGRSVDGRPQVIRHQYSIRVCLLPALLDENHALLCYWVQEPVTGQIIGPRRENTVIILLNAHIKLNPNDLSLYPQISISQPLSERFLLK